MWTPRGAGVKIVVEKSTVPVSTADAMTCVLQDNSPAGIQFQVLSNPEFLAEGTAVDDLMTPDRVLIGGQPTAEGEMAVEALASVYAHWVPRNRIKGDERVVRRAHEACGERVPRPAHLVGQRHVRHL